MIPEIPRPPLKGKKALVVGIANEHSIAYGCAAAFHQLEADVAITYLNAKAKPYVEPLARSLNASIFAPLDVANPGELEALFERVQINFLVALIFVSHHCNAFEKDSRQ